MTRYYPNPNLDMAVYFLQNHPEYAGHDPKRLQNVTVHSGETIGRSAWERAKKVLPRFSEPRKLITFDFNTLMTAYIGDNTRLVTLSKSRKFLRRKLEIIQADAGYVHVFKTRDNMFHVYAMPAKEDKKAA